MTDGQKTAAGVAVSVAVTLLYCAVLVAVAFPGARARLDRGRQWGRWYAWRARWATLPSWVQEGLIVRGRGPVE